MVDIFRYFPPRRFGKTEDNLQMIALIRQMKSCLQSPHGKLVGRRLQIRLRFHTPFDHVQVCNNLELHESTHGLQLAQSKALYFLISLLNQLQLRYDLVLLPQPLDTKRLIQYYDQDLCQLAKL